MIWLLIRAKNTVQYADARAYLDFVKDLELEDSTSVYWILDLCHDIQFNMIGQRNLRTIKF